MSTILIDKDMLDWLRAAGIDTSRTRRVVIDIRVGEPVLVFTEGFAEASIIANPAPDAVREAVARAIAVTIDPEMAPSIDFEALAAELAASFNRAIRR